MAHELGSRDRHPLARLQRYCHIDEFLDTRSAGCTDQTPRVNVNRRRYGTAMQIPAATCGTVYQGGSIFGPGEEIGTICKGPDMIHKPKPDGR